MAGLFYQWRALRKERQIRERFCDSLVLTPVCVDVANGC
jgi:hypothetical protein